MNRRNMFAQMGMAVAAVAGASTVFAVDKLKDDEDAGCCCGTECCDTCSKCVLECNKCYAHCVAQIAAGHKEYETAMKACLDCTSFCNTCISVCTRNGVMQDIACSACTQACTMCAKECAKFPDDKVMVACAKMCMTCAKMCGSCCKKK